MKRPNSKDADMSRKVSRRAFVVGGLQLGLMGVLTYRMRSLQVDQSEDFRLLAEENRINIRLIPPSRGLLFDRDGKALVENEQNYRIVMVREDAGDVDDVLTRLSKVVELTPENYERAKQELARRSPFVPVTILERLEWDDIAKVSANAPALPGVTAEVGLSRTYPMGSYYAHILGYVGPVSDYDLSRIDDQDPLLQIPRFQIGKTGVESKMEKPLRGKAGTKRIEVNAVGRVMRELGREESVTGSNIQLSIDSDLQAYVQARLEGESAAAVVMDCENGDLHAIGSAPTFDPNMFVRGISVANWNALNEDPYRPLAAKTVQGTYPPGSTFKMVTALTALEDGQVSFDETVKCTGHKEVADVRFHCWKRSGHGNVNLKKSLKESCDVYYYDLALRVGIDKISEMAKRLGIGVRHDLPLSAVARGLSPNKAWKQEVRGRDWRIGDTVNASIGQGDVLASPLQLAVMTARIATGRSVEPRLVKSIDGVPTPDKSGDDLGLNENNLRQIRAAMFAVSNENGGTAYKTRINTARFKMAGKTGTSQVRRITAEERARGVTRNEDLPWERRDHALFVCYAPADNPKYAISVVVEHGGGGSTAAAPIARDIMLQALYGATPPLEAYPPDARSTAARTQRAVQEFDPFSRPTKDAKDEEQT